jgi:hypothetical protein
MKLRDWIDYDKLNWKILSSNPNAIELLEKNKNKIEYYCLSLNPNAIDLLKKNQENINWNRLSFNANAIELLKKILIKLFGSIFH